MEAVAVVTIHIIKVKVIKQTQSLNVRYVKNSTLAYADTKENLNVEDAICLGIIQMIAMITSNWQIVQRRRKKCPLQIYFMLVMQQV